MSTSEYSTLALLCEANGLNPIALSFIYATGNSVRCICKVGPYEFSSDSCTNEPRARKDAIKIANRVISALCEKGLSAVSHSDFCKNVIPVSHDFSKKKIFTPVIIGNVDSCGKVSRYSLSNSKNNNNNGVPIFSEGCTDKFGHLLFAASLPIVLPASVVKDLFNESSTLFNTIVEIGRNTIKAREFVKVPTGLGTNFDAICQSGVFQNIAWASFQSPLSAVTKMEWYYGFKCIFDIYPFYLRPEATPSVKKLGWTEYQADWFGVYTKTHDKMQLPVGIVVPGGAYKEYPCVRSVLDSGEYGAANSADVIRICLEVRKCLVFTSFDQAATFGCNTIFCAPYNGVLDEYLGSDRFMCDSSSSGQYRITDDSTMRNLVSRVFSCVLQLC